MKKSNARTTIRNLLFGINNNPISRHWFKKEMEKRSKMKLTNITDLSKHVSMFSPYTNEFQKTNDWYGHASTFKKYLDLPNNYVFNCVIEHGMYFSDQVADIELESKLPFFLTYSPYRVNIFKNKYGLRAYAIGPFIRYSRNYLTKRQLRSEKKRLGKTILYFPSHSSMGITDNYNQETSIEKIKGISKGFDTIRICMYWKDVLSGKHLFYQNLGFECVTAGHILDPLFLPRLKSIIQTSDLTISNDASSPLSYSIYMNKPHIIFYQRPNIFKTNYYRTIMQSYWKSEPYKEIISEFSKIEFSITSKQRRLMNIFCGLNSTKSKERLKNIIINAN